MKPCGVKPYDTRLRFLMVPIELQSPRSISLLAADSHAEL